MSFLDTATEAASSAAIAFEVLILLTVLVVLGGGGALLVATLFLTIAAAVVRLDDEALVFVGGSRPAAIADELVVGFVVGLADVEVLGNGAVRVEGTAGFLLATELDTGRLV